MRVWMSNSRGLIKKNWISIAFVAKNNYISWWLSMDFFFFCHPRPFPFKSRPREYNNHPELNWNMLFINISTQFGVCFIICGLWWILGNSRSLSCLSALYSEGACKDKLVKAKGLLAIEDYFLTRICLHIKDSSR